MACNGNKSTFLVDDLIQKTSHCLLYHCCSSISSFFIFSNKPGTKKVRRVQNNFVLFIVALFGTLTLYFLIVHLWTKQNDKNSNALKLLSWHCCYCSIVKRKKKIIQRKCVHAYNLSKRPSHCYCTNYSARGCYPVEGCINTVSYNIHIKYRNYIQCTLWKYYFLS